MLKSITTQIALTVFFGPLGLAYSSLAAAVFLTLVLAVLFFTALGPLAVLLVWPVAIVTGLVFVKIHNDGIRQSGTRLLLGPDEEAGDLTTTIGSWGRGLAVLSLMAVGGYIALIYLPGSKDNEVGLTGSIADKSVQSVDIVSTDYSNTEEGATDYSGTLDSTSVAVPVADTTFVESSSDSFSDNDSTPSVAVSEVISRFSSSTDDTFAEVTFSETQVTPVIIDSSSSSGNLDNGGGQYFTVDAIEVNLRDGPGTNFSILDQVAQGDELRELDRAGSWVNVVSTSDGKTGWIYGRLISPR